MNRLIIADQGLSLSGLLSSIRPSLLITLLSGVVLSATPQAQAALATPLSVIDGTDSDPLQWQTINTDDGSHLGAPTFGENANNTVSTMQSAWWDPNGNNGNGSVQSAFSAALATLSAGQMTIRFPAGTNGNYWDWKAGVNIDVSKAYGVLSPQIVLGASGAPVVAAGPIPPPQPPTKLPESLSLDQLYQAFVQPSSSGNPSNMQVIWNINMMTCSTDPSVPPCSNGRSWQQDPIQYQVDMLISALGKGLPVQYIELGNEFYVANTDDIHAFGNPSDVTLTSPATTIARPGYNYGILCRIWAGEIKRRLAAYNGGTYASVASKLQFGVVGDVDPKSAWNFDVMQALTATPPVTYTDSSVSLGSSGVSSSGSYSYGPLANYNLTLHPYYNSAFGTWYLLPTNVGYMPSDYTQPYLAAGIDLTKATGNYSKDAKNDATVTDVNPIDAVAQVLAQPFVQWGSHQAFKGYPGSSGDSQYWALDAEGTNNLAASGFVPPGNSVWYTEYNLWDKNVPLYGTWVHGLFFGLQSLLLLENGNTRFALGTSIIGTGVFSAMFAGPDPAISKDANSLDPETTSTVSWVAAPAFLKAYTTMPKAQIHGLSAVGQVNSLVADAAAGALRVYPIHFLGDQDPGSSPTPFVTFVYDNNQYQCAYPKLYGCSFFSYSGDPGGKTPTASAISGKSIIINTSGETISLSNVYRALRTGGHGPIMVKTQLGPAAQYGSYPSYYPGVYLTGATTNGIPNELAGVPSYQVPTNQMITIPPYSITELSWTYTN